jgi:hypothetical protein
MNDEELATVAHPDTVQIIVEADTSMVEPPFVTPPKRPPQAPSTTPPAAENPAGGIATEPPPVDISVQISEAARSAMEQEARARISRTNEILGGIDSSSFTPAKQDALITIQGLIQSAGTALDHGDVQAADSLSRKALLLATDLALK